MGLGFIRDKHSQSQMNWLCSRVLKLLLPKYFGEMKPRTAGTSGGVWLIGYVTEVSQQNQLLPFMRSYVTRLRVDNGY